MRPRLWAFLIATILLTGSALAGPRAKSTTSQRTVVRFDGDTIDGNLMRPDGDLMNGRPDIPMPSLVQPPKDFSSAAHRTLLAAAAAISPGKAVAGQASGTQPMKGGGTNEPKGGADVGRDTRSTGGTR